MTGALPMIAQGLPLAERSSGLACAPAQDHAAQRLARWRAQYPFATDQWWSARLSAAGLTEPQLLALLGEAAAQIAGRAPEPSWQEWLDRVLADGQDEGVATGGAARGIYFGALTMPLVAQARAGLLARLRAIPGGSGVLDPARLTEQLSVGLVAALDRMVLRTLVVEMERARLAGQLRADDAGERFAEFADGFARARRRRELLGQYPALARQLAIEAGGWVARSARFAGHLTDNADHVRDVFFDGHAPGMIEDVRPGLGDRHSGGSVTLVRWAGGLELMYKPRSLALDVHFGQLVAWAGTKGLTYPLHTAASLDLGDHGWMEVVRAQACADEAQRRRFYHRQGSLLALLYLLGANDMHGENLIAVGEHPVLVDLETLVQPKLPGGVRGQTPADAAAEEAAVSSVLAVGLLPQRSPGSREGGAADVSGLGWAPGQRGPLPVPVIRDARTDMMRVELAAPQLPVPAHRPVAGEAQLRLLDYAPDVLAGFTEAYQLCQEHAAELAEGPLASFRGDRVRVVVRHTAWYAAILSMSFHPDVLRDGLDREQLFDTLWREAPRSPVLAACAEHERADLWCNDIPLFATATDSTALLDSEQRPVPGLTLTPGIECMLSRLAGLGPEDLARQRWLITTALGTTAEAEDAVSATAPRRSVAAAQPLARRHLAAASGASRADLLSAADAIGHHLRQTAFREAGSAQWLGISSPQGTNWSVGPLRADFYNGLTGIALFLGHLGELTGDTAHSELARHTLRTARQQLDDDLAPRYGGMAGAGGIIYTLCELARLWDQEDLLEAAGRCARRTAPAASDDITFDFVGGSAGTIAGLLALNLMRPSDWLVDQVQACADRLLATAVGTGSGIGWLPRELSQADGAIAPIAGFAHGNAGIIAPLFMATDLLGDDRYRHAAAQALAYEQAFYDPSSGTWDQSRCYPELSVGSRLPPQVSWCRGAAGIGISRLSCLTRAGDQDASHREIDAALAAVSQANARSHCLCHGVAGTLELYLHAAATLGNPRWQLAADQLAARMLASIAKHGWSCGTPLNAQTPGLMVGLAGIGYGLLRAADPAHVPSVLALQAVQQPEEVIAPIPSARKGRVPT